MPCAAVPICCAHSGVGICADPQCRSILCPHHGSSATSTSSLSYLLVGTGVHDKPCRELKGQRLVLASAEPNFAFWKTPSKKLLSRLRHKSKHSLKSQAQHSMPLMERSIFNGHYSQTRSEHMSHSRDWAAPKRARWPCGCAPLSRRCAGARTPQRAGGWWAPPPHMTLSLRRDASWALRPG